MLPLDKCVQKNNTMKESENFILLNKRYENYKK
jgi:hypothetical protein